jgi:hypothetical protein
MIPKDNFVYKSRLIDGNHVRWYPDLKGVMYRRVTLVKILGDTCVISPWYSGKEFTVPTKELEPIISQETMDMFERINCPDRTSRRRLRGN